MNNKQKLELTWIGKEKRPKLEPRILLEDPEKSYHAKHRVSDNDIFDNRLIFGDNLLALQALQQEFAGQVRLVYIDPPFNTGQAFEHYDDGIEHSIWLDLMAKRCDLLKSLLRPDGVLVVHLDQEEVHYLKVVLDEIFGRANFLGQIAYERSGVSGLGQGGAFVVNTHEYMLWYAKDKSAFRAEDLSGAGELEPKDMKRYNRVLVSPGIRTEVARFIAPSTGEPVVIYKHEGAQVKTISLRNFEEREGEISAEYVEHFDRVHRLTSVQKENEFQNRILSYCRDGIYSADYLVSRGKKEGERTTSFYQNGQVFVWLKDTAEVVDGKIGRTGKLSDFWTHSDIPKADLANEGGVEFRRGKKPEKLLERVIKMATKPFDLVLDSFAGSGTTGAVAHKLRRRWIMVELGEHCHTHVAPRLKSVIDARDSSGITASSRWSGGGGFRYFSLAPTLIVNDRWGNPVINPEYNAAQLAEALAKLEGFNYSPSETHWWQHGRSSERDFIYVTTQNLSAEQLQALSDEVGPERSLLVCCAAFHRVTAARAAERWPNLTLKKIPKMVLARCEWGHDDYSLNVANLPMAEIEKAGPAASGNRVKNNKSREAALVSGGQGGLFGEDQQ
jgi:adenine-specific DNA-methyltransferase